MIRNNTGRVGRRAGGGRFAASNMNRRVAQNSKLVHGASPIRIQARKQLISIPNHNYQLKIRKMIRMRMTGSSLGTGISYLNILTGIRSELNIASNETDGEIVTLHGVRVYSQDSHELSVRVYDRENSGTAAANTIAYFTDVSSQVCHIAFVYPVQDRPSFNRSQTSTVVLTVITHGDMQNFYVDLDVTYTRTSAGNILATVQNDLSEPMETS